MSLTNVSLYSYQSKTPSCYFLRSGKRNPNLAEDKSLKEREAAKRENVKSSLQFMLQNYWEKENSQKCNHLWKKSCENYGQMVEIKGIEMQSSAKKRNEILE